MIIPFFIPHAGCPHQCVFCDQKRITGQTSVPAPESIPPVISSYLNGRKDADVAEVAFFGGSFTALPVEAQHAYLEQVRPFIASGEVSCIRVSTRPDGISPSILTLLYEHHVRTVELGAQSLDDEVLRRSGRGHTASDTVRAMTLLKQKGFVTGIQLMPGLPGDTDAVFLRTVDQVIGLRPELVRIYPALVIRATQLERLYREGDYAPLPLERAVALCAAASRRFTDAGIEVIRMGLQSTAGLEQPGTIVAGPWHPAFGQLVASRLFLDDMRGILARPHAAGTITFRVNPADFSTAVGQKRGNVDAIRTEYGIDALILPDGSVDRGRLAV